MIAKLSTTYGIADSSGNRVSSFLYDMPGNLVKRSGTAPEATFSFDKNGRTLAQGYDGSSLGYNYYDDSYRLNRVTGSIALDSARNASRTNNFVYDASGRMIADSSKNLSVEYDPYGMPVSFVQMSDSSIWRELMVYDPSGWRIATFAYENDALQAIRTDIMVGGKKALERHRIYVANDSSVTEYRMIQGKSGIVGRILPDSSKEWYIKDYQGSLVMTLVDNGPGNVLAYELYGAQKKIQVSGDSPAEQYTGKELNERVGLYYYGARFFDPVLGIWMTPDPARQYMNLYAFGGDPVNKVDRDGRFSWKKAVGFVVAEVLTGGGVSASASALTLGAGGSQSAAINMGKEAYSNGTDFEKWDWNKIWNSTVSSNLAQIPGYGETMTNISFLNRLYDSDDKLGVFGDYLFGGYGVDFVGHEVGRLNTSLFGGNMDYYRGNVVYSEGALSVMEQMGISGGGDHFGSAALVTHRDDGGTIAHEFNHLRQTESTGNRFRYLYHYLKNNGWNPFPNDEYYKNEMEMDSYYKGFLYQAECIDIYGNEIRDEAHQWTHKEMSSIFYNGGEYKNRDGKTYIWNGYKNDHPEVDYGDSWTWSDEWWKDY